MTQRVGGPSTGTSRRRGGRHCRARGGYVLVLFVMLFLGLLALAALVIDMGFARLAQRQMQSAADSAALEGLRWRDMQQNLPPAWSADPNFQNEVGKTPSADLVRRWAASQVVADGPVGNGSAAQPSMFADYYEGSGGTLHYGAGPVVNFSGGIGPPEFAAAQTMTVPAAPAPPVYQPMRADGNSGLELNSTNAIEGDVVAGSYGINAGYNAAQSADEDSNYNRRDFTSVLAASSSAASALLVRMRRTNNNNGLDQEPGVSSSGPTLPILFGRGSMMAHSGNPGQLSVQSGVTARAASIAAVGPMTLATSGGSLSYTAGLAKTIGPSYAIQASASSSVAVSMAGLAPFAFESGYWAALSGGTSSGSASLNLSGGSLQTSNGQTVGLLLSTSASSLPVEPNHLYVPVTAIGQPVNALAQFSGSALIQDGGLAVYVPIYTAYPLGGQLQTIIGFGYLAAGQWTYTPAGANTHAQLTWNPCGASAAPQISSQNVSASMGLTIPASFSQQDVKDLMQLHNNSVTDPKLAGYSGLVNSIYAPVLVNHYIGPNSQ